MLLVFWQSLNIPLLVALQVASDTSTEGKYFSFSCRVESFVRKFASAGSIRWTAKIWQLLL